MVDYLFPGVALLVLHALGLLQCGREVELLELDNLGVGLGVWCPRLGYCLSRVLRLRLRC